MSENQNRVAARQKVIEATVNLIRKKHGTSAIMRLSEDRMVNVDVIPTGALTLDLALGVGGIPKGRITEIYGPESSGKTTLMLSVVSEIQKQGGVAAFIDAEHALDPVYASAIGVDLENLLVSQPATAEEALDITENLVRSGAIDLVVIDSVAALVPKAEIEGNFGDSFVGLQARLMSQALRKLTAAISRSKTAVVFINQIREKVGVMFGNPETTPGGRALKFFASVRLDIRKIMQLKKGGEVMGDRVRVKVAKNKVAPPFKIAEFDILYGKGINKEGSVLDAALDVGIVKRSGSWYSWGDVKLGQGRDNAVEYLKDNPELLEKLRNEVWEKYSENRKAFINKVFGKSEDSE